MVRPILIALALAAPSVLPAQTARHEASQAASGQPPQRIRNVQLQRGQACPPSESNEVVVCSTLEEPYRIPKQFRDDGPIPAESQSWANRAATVDQVSKVAGGLPDTCSAIGSGGQTGCALQLNRAYAAEKRAQRRAAESVPGGSGD